MNVVGIVVEGDLVHVGDIGIGLVFGGGDAAGFTEDLALLPCLFGEVARDDIVRLARVHQVEGNGGELLARAALHEQDAIAVGNVHQLAQIGFRLLDDGGKRLVSVADLADAHAGARKVEQFFLRLFEHLEREHRRACRKVVNSHIVISSEFFAAFR